MTWIKICGITPRRALDASDAGANALGFVFYRRARHVTAETRARSSPACPANRKGRSVRQRNGGPRSRHRQTRRLTRAIERRREHDSAERSSTAWQTRTRKRLAASAIFRAWRRKCLTCRRTSVDGIRSPRLVEPTKLQRQTRAQNPRRQERRLFLEPTLSPGVISAFCSIPHAKTRRRRGFRLGACNPGRIITASAS